MLNDLTYVEIQSSGFVADPDCILIVLQVEFFTEFKVTPVIGKFYRSDDSFKNGFAGQGRAAAAQV